MSQVFIDELAIGEPDYFLGAAGASHAEQIARVIDRLAPVIEETKPDLMLVPGDVNSTLAAAIAAKATRVPVGHIEAGLRSFDRSLPEETNRIIVDAISQLLFIHSPEARTNLLDEGAKKNAIHYAGVHFQQNARAVDAKSYISIGLAALIGLQALAFGYWIVSR